MIQFEEIQQEEGQQEDAEAMATGNKAGFSGPRFGASEDDPTDGEWHRTKTMEIWLNTIHPLTEPKWSRGNLRDNIDPSSLFQNIIHIVDQNTVGLRTVIPRRRAQGFERADGRLRGRICLNLGEIGRWLPVEKREAT
jgi:hypothetical protein